MRIVSNFEGFPGAWHSASGREGTSVFARSFKDFLHYRSSEQTLFVVNCDPPLTLRLAALRIAGIVRPPVIAVDLILRRPAGTLQHVTTALKRRLFKGVDYFLHYFRNVEGLNEVFGIGSDRSRFVPFKANLWDFRSTCIRPDGDYVLCFGRSLRDFDTFFSAIEACGLPGAIVEPHKAQIFAHGSRFTRSRADLPRNVRVLDHDLSGQSQAAVLQKAKIVVIPILREAIVSAGISTALNAMLLGKCVIATAGPGMSDIFTNELILVPPEDSAALADAISRAWEDKLLRTETARLGHAYAAGCGTAADFYQRIIDALAERFGGTPA